MTNRILALVAIVVSTFAVVPAEGQEIEELRREIEQLKKGQQELEKEIAALKSQLQPAQRRNTPSATVSVTLDLSASPVKGNPAAPITLVEFSDYQCPYCSRHVRNTMPRLAQEYIDSGKMRHVFLDLPLESIHKQAFKAAEAARCAGDQGRFWEMHDELFANQKSLEPWSPHAEAIGLDVEAFQQCLDSGRHAAAVRRDMSQAKSAGATGTPTFFLARTEPGKTTVTTVSRLRGAQPYETFKVEIDKLLGESE